MELESRSEWAEQAPPQIRGLDEQSGVSKRVKRENIILEATELEISFMSTHRKR